MQLSKVTQVNKSLDLPEANSQQLELIKDAIGCRSINYLKLST
jgi:hypothetical protein